MQLAATVIYVDDVAPVLEFYGAAFGCEIRFYDADVQLAGRTPGARYQFAEVATEGGTLQFGTSALGVLLMPGFEPSPTGGPLGIEIAFTCADVQSAFDRAVGAGATTVRPPSQMPWGQTVAYVRSIEGTYVGLCSPLAAAD
jgi:uncharacterized glyoxalase superfamily protein PhnB